ncbi:TetR/AcrR family transcriptional regulator [Salinisphaera sp.]|uniref:TetR/AcrR family transcriptional regulator n=1 Tax=Salinisphaera sp. TaxID=1914330 RepID=UPI002D7998C6|nr:TetR/AcrR family transcriptional regulator [Salinisphaera sp.]HET7315723.1 TetR/AcrR family transcriptional regulator [Salinisphaera sp.]
MGDTELAIQSIDFSELEGPTGTTARDRILNTACRLFYRHGVNSVGIDRIIDESGVAKMSLYRNFGSKSALVEAYLKHRDAYWRDVFRSHVLNLDLPAIEKVLAYFDLMYQWLSAPEFFGCAYINATAERLGTESITAVIRHHKRQNLDLLVTLIEQAGFIESAELADQLFLLSEGAIVTASISGTPDSMQTARSAAERLLRISQP